MSRRAKSISIPYIFELLKVFTWARMHDLRCKIVILVGPFPQRIYYIFRWDCLGAADILRKCLEELELSTVRVRLLSEPVSWFELVKVLKVLPSGHHSNGSHNNIFAYVNLLGLLTRGLLWNIRQFILIMHRSKQAGCKDVPNRGKLLEA